MLIPLLIIGGALLAIRAYSEEPVRSVPRGTPDDAAKMVMSPTNKAGTIAAAQASFWPNFKREVAEAIRKYSPADAAAADDLELQAEQLEALNEEAYAAQVAAYLLNTIETSWHPMGNATNQLYFFRTVPALAYDLTGPNDVFLADMTREGDGYGPAHYTVRVPWPRNPASILEVTV